MIRKVTSAFNYAELGFTKQYVALTPDIMGKYDTVKGFFTMPPGGREGTTMYLHHKNMDKNIDKNPEAKYIQSFKSELFYVDEYELNGKQYYKIGK